MDREVSGGKRRKVVAREKKEDEGERGRRQNWKEEGRGRKETMEETGVSEREG